MNDERWAAAAILLGPLVLLAGIAAHPYIPDLTQKDVVVGEMTQDTARWFYAHLLVAIGSGLVLLAFLAVRAHVRSTVGQEPWTGRAIVPLTLGTAFFVMLPAMEIAMLASVEAGTDVLATQIALDTWFRPIMMAGAFLLAIGSVSLCVGVVRARILTRVPAWVFTAGVLLAAVSRFIPKTASLLVGTILLVVGLAPVATSAWRVAARQPTSQGRTPRAGSA